jgi:hypothetical protein
MDSALGQPRTGKTASDAYPSAMTPQRGETRFRLQAPLSSSTAIFKHRFLIVKRRAIVQFVVLLLNRYWNQERRARSRCQEQVPPEPQHRVSPKGL